MDLQKFNDIYESIKKILNDYLQNESGKISCIIEKLRSKGFEKKFETSDLLFNQGKLTDEAQKYIDIATLECEEIPSVEASTNMEVFVVTMISGVFLFFALRYIIKFVYRHIMTIIRD
ncbi:hypothetical protein PVAND_009422 [Polypedilum vanderplanki]|uniref:Uncharacterized protein n=1 Tax=Polypedilum vanderplanki TaxID=319348 RepID=A0A9J6CD78_POLVA|nr:hypothetical protein PVAND_009422 [Polypedilum vanderplanki]